MSGVRKIKNIIEIQESDIYGLVVLDSDCVTHYWDHDGTYDGWSIEHVTEI